MAAQRISIAGLRIAGLERASADERRILAQSRLPPRRSCRALAGGRHAGAREWVRFLRQRNRIVGAIGQPLIFWLLFGAGLGPSFRLPERGDAVRFPTANISFPARSF